MYRNPLIGVTINRYTGILRYKLKTYRIAIRNCWTGFLRYNSCYDSLLGSIQYIPVVNCLLSRQIIRVDNLSIRCSGPPLGYKLWNVYPTHLGWTTHANRLQITGRFCKQCTHTFTEQWITQVINYQNCDTLAFYSTLVWINETSLRGYR